MPACPALWQLLQSAPEWPPGKPPVAWVYLTVLHRRVVWQSSHCCEVTKWPFGLPVAVVPLWQLEQLPVLTPVAVDIAYSYRVPRGMAVEAGDFVLVPLGSREVTGVVWETRKAPGGNLKSIKAKRDLPPLADPLRQFVDWVARWTMAPRGMVLRMGVRAPDAAGPESRALLVRWGHLHAVRSALGAGATVLMLVAALR
mgnify:CR=1 FL=1